MNANLKWRKDLNQGNIGEKIVATWLEKYKNMTIVKFNDTMDYDLLMLKDNGSSLTFEIKTDRYEFFKGHRTNNIFIETRCNGKKSGLWGTIADVYCFYFPDFGELYFIKTSELRTYIQMNPEMFVRRDFSGDGGKVSGFTIDRYKFKHIFKFYEIKKLKIWDKVEKSDF